MQPWKTRSRRTVLECGRWLTVESHSVELPDGRIIDDWPWVITPSYVNVVAVTAEGAFVCFRQTKYAVGDISLAIVGGFIEPGEDPLPAARRELLEESGYRADRWTSLGRYVVDSNRGAGEAFPFLAEGARPIQPPDADDLEEQQLLLLSRAEVDAALKRGEFRSLSVAAALALALHRLDVPAHPGA
jgi:ADP-ribose pyrophosphatase